MTSFLAVSWTSVFITIVHVHWTLSSTRETLFCQEGVTVQNNNGSGQVITRAQGTSSYSNDMHCRWNLHTTPGKKLQLDISSYHIEFAPDTSRCSSQYDYIEFRDGQDASSPSITIACGSTKNPHSLISNGSDIFIQWNSNGQNVRPYTGITVQFETFESSECPQNWFEYQGHCYKVMSHKQRWSVSQTYCNYVKANLASIADSNELNALKGMLNNISSPAVYIGLSDQTGDFKYIDTTAYKPVGWKNGYPLKNKEENCVAIDTSRQLVQFNCDRDEISFICKMKKGHYTKLYAIEYDNQNTESFDRDGLTTWGVIGIIIGCIAGVILIMILAIVLYRHDWTSCKRPSTSSPPPASPGRHCRVSATAPPSENYATGTNLMNKNILPPPVISTNNEGHFLQQDFPPKPPSYEESETLTTTL